MGSVSFDLGHEAKRFAAFLKTKFSPKIDHKTLAKLILDAGWTGEDAVTAFAVVGGESGFRTHATNINADGKGDYGLFQINDIHRPTDAEKYDPAANAKKGFQVWNQRKRWDGDPFLAWMAYRDRDKTESRRQSWAAFTEMGRRAIAEAQAER